MYIYILFPRVNTTYVLWNMSYIYTLIYIQHAPNTIYILHCTSTHIYICMYVVSNRHSGHLYTGDLSPNGYINRYLKTAISLGEILGKRGQPIATFI